MLRTPRTRKRQGRMLPSRIPKSLALPTPSSDTCSCQIGREYRPGVLSHRCLILDYGNPRKLTALTYTVEVGSLSVRLGTAGIVHLTWAVLLTGHSKQGDNCRALAHVYHLYVPVWTLPSRLYFIFTLMYLQKISWYCMQFF